MALQDVLGSVERSERTLTVFNPTASAAVPTGGERGKRGKEEERADERDLVAELEAALADRNVTVQSATTPSGRPENFAVLEVDGVVLATVDVAALDGLLDGAMSDGLGFDTDAYDVVLRHLQEATFTSYDRPRMLEATREIEDRAFRVGHGHLRAGFQTLDRLAAQRERYVELARRGLDVTVYAAPGGERPELPGVTVLTSDAEEIRDHWFVAFDGGGENGQQSALLAEERADGFYGCWTYDADVVSWICTHLADRYEQGA